MAIGKRLADPIRVVSVTCDTAIDREKTPYDYSETRDEKVVVAHPGEQLTWFTLRPLKPDLAAHLKGLGKGTAEQMAFQYACIACSDPALLPPDAWTGEAEQRRIKGQALRELPDQLWEELGSVALQMGGLSVGEERRFVLPLGLPVIRRRRRDTTAGSAAPSGADRPAE